MSTKFVLAIVDDRNARSVMESLVAHQYPVTRASSTGGFLRRGSVTFLIGVDEAQVESVLDVIRFACHVDADEGDFRATIFVLNATAFEQV
ncbi:MAG: hypothetical protein Kow0077_21500 [Anaerolineae bacterium]